MKPSRMGIMEPLLDSTVHKQSNDRLTRRPLTGQKGCEREALAKGAVGHGLQDGSLTLLAKAVSQLSPRITP